MKKKRLDRGVEPYRINHLSWWAQEMPSEEEMEEGRKNLAKHNNTVDFIISHCCAFTTQTRINASFDKRDCLTEYFEELRQRIKFKKWFFGHYHDNQNVTSKEILIYEQIIRIV